MGEWRAGKGAVEADSGNAGASASVSSQPRPPNEVEQVERLAKLLGVELLELQGSHAQQEPPGSLEAYNALRANLTEAAKHSRNLFMTHLAVQSYALIVLAGLDDMKFFQQGNQQTLPIINASVALSWFIPTLAVLSFLVFVYWQMYHRKMWLLAGEVSDAAAQHLENPAFVPAHGSYRYPWIAFFVTDKDRALRVGVGAFGFFQWVPMPLVQFVCWTRTARLSGSMWDWITPGLPWGPFFGALGLASVAAVWRLRVMQQTLIPREVRPALGRLGRSFEAWASRHAGLAKSLRALYWATVASTFIALALVARTVWIGAQHGLQLDHLRAPNRNFSGLDLAGASLRRANFQGAYLYGANLYGAYLNDAYLNNAYLNDAKSSALDEHAPLETGHHHVRDAVTRIVLLLSQLSAHRSGHRADTLHDFAKFLRRDTQLLGPILDLVVFAQRNPAPVCRAPILLVIRHF